MGALVSRAFGSEINRDDLRRLTGSPEQAFGAELFERLDGRERGVRVVRLRSGEIEIEVVVDRALDISHASVRGIPMAWISPTGVASPALAENAGWGPFRTFFGGLLTTCGLDHTLGPVEVETPWYQYPGQSTRAFPLHGRISTTPAILRGYGVDWEAEEPAVFVRGEVRQATVFGECLTMEREIRIPIGSGEIQLRDRVRNDGYAPTPHMVLYHVNAGWPLLGPHARVVVVGGEPRVATPAAKDADWHAVESPARGVVEQVWEHTPLVDQTGRGYAAIINTDIGDGRAAALEVRWDMATLPRLFQWRVMSESNYVVGLEPGNLPLEGREVAAANGDLVMIEPGASIDHKLDLRLIHAEVGQALVTGLTSSASGGLA